jgi:hypothetical protein
MSKPNPDCPKCHGTGWLPPPYGKEPCDCWRYVQGG